MPAIWMKAFNTFSDLTPVMRKKDLDTFTDFMPAIWMKVYYNSG